MKNIQDDQQTRTTQRDIKPMQNSSTKSRPKHDEICTACVPICQLAYVRDAKKMRL